MNRTIYNKIISLILVLGLALSFTACEDVFDKSLARVSDSRLTFEDVVNDAKKVERLYNSCYSGMQKHRCRIHNWVSFESLTDNAFDEKYGGSLGRWYRGTLSPSESALKLSDNGIVGSWGTNGSYWGAYWEAIKACNLFINNVDNINVPPDDLLPEYLVQLVDEARILRAYYHIQLLGMYGPIPFITEDKSTNPSYWSNLTRPDYHDVALEIAEELQDVIDHDKVDYKRLVQSEKSRVPLAFAYGLKSRVLLYSASPLNNPEGDESKYALAAAAAKQFIDRGEYSLEPFENTKKALYNSSLADNVEAGEVIWRGTDPFRNLSNIAGLNLKETVPSIANQKGFRVGEVPTQELVDCYELKTGEMIVDSYSDGTHATPIISEEANRAGYDDVNDPYANRDARFYRDILYNGSYFGQTYDDDSIWVYTYQQWVDKTIDNKTVRVLEPIPGTGNNGPTVDGEKHQTYTGYYFAKDRNPIYYGKQTHGNLCYQYSIRMRFAEIYLNYAEALCGANQLSEACDALDMTRMRALQPSIKEVPGFTLDKEWLMKRIHNERRVELVLEDHRFFDVRRWDIISSDQHNAISGMLAVKVEGEEDKYTYSRYQLKLTWECHNEKYKVLPIPAKDIKNMPAMLQPLAWR